MISGNKQVIVCKSFSDDNRKVAVSSSKRSVKFDDPRAGFGYCFLKHPKIENNQLLQWTIRVPKFVCGNLGMVIIRQYIIFDFLKITFQRYWYILDIISINPIKEHYWREDEYDQSIIVYFLGLEEVYGGSDPGRTVKQIEEDDDGLYPGGDFKMELDLSAKTFVMELDGERTTIDSNLGDYEFSPFVILDDESPEINLL